MEQESELQKRKEHRLKNFDYSSRGMYFITVCTMERQNYFWNNVGARIARPQDVELSLYGKIVDHAINNIPVIYPSVLVDRYVIMPDHIHLLFSICPEEDGRAMRAPTVSRVVNQLKGYVTKQIKSSIWQKLFFDHVIRDREDYLKHVSYIRDNPLKWNDKQDGKNQ